MKILLANSAKIEEGDKVSSEYLLAIACVCDRGSPIPKGIQWSTVGSCSAFQFSLHRPALTNSSLLQLGHTPLHLAASSGHKAVVDCLLQWGAKKDAVDQARACHMSYGIAQVMACRAICWAGPTGKC